MIKIGDFIRTKDGYIGKVERIITAEGGYYCCDTVMGSSYKNDIKKHSPNIIDLVEVGDTVNGKLIIDITGEYIKTIDSIHNKYWLSNNIKTILTHEVYEMNCYKVGGEDE